MHAGFQSMGPRYNVSSQEKSMAQDPATTLSKHSRRRSTNEGLYSRAAPRSSSPMGAPRSSHAPSPRHQLLRAQLLKSGAAGLPSPSPSRLQSASRPSSSESRHGNPAESSSKSRPPSLRLSLHHIASAKRLASRSSSKAKDATKAKKLTSGSPMPEARTASTRTSPEPRNAEKSGQGQQSRPAGEADAAKRRTPPTASPSGPSKSFAYRRQGMRREAPPPPESPNGPSKSFVNRQGMRRRSTIGLDVGLAAADEPAIVEPTPEEKMRMEEEERERERERERELRLAQVDRDLKEIMTRHKESVVPHDFGTRGAKGEGGSTLGGLSSIFGESFEELTVATDSMSPVQQRELLLRQTSAQMAAVRNALSSLEAEKTRAMIGHQNPPSATAPLGPSSPSPPAHSPPIRKAPHHHEYPPPGQAEGTKATLNGQAMLRLDLKAISDQPGTRGLIPSLPSAVVRRANFRINRIYRAHVQGTERIQEILSNVCPEARTLLLDREIEPARHGSSDALQNAVAEAGMWQAAKPSCAPDPPWLDGDGLGGTGTAGIPIVAGREGSKGVSWIMAGEGGGTRVAREPLKGITPTNPRVQANGFNKERGGLLDSSQRVMLSITGPRPSDRLAQLRQGSKGAGAGTGSVNV